MHTSVALLLELGVILTVISVLGTWARRLSLSPVPLYLLAGLFLGEGGIAPVPAAGRFLETGASIGIVLLLLALGLEFSVTEFAVSMRRHVPSAGLDLLLNALPGALAGFLLGLDGVGILALAGVTYISSSGIVARLLSDLRRLGNRETPAVLSVLVLEDFAMAAYLPVVVVLASGGTWWQAVAGVLLAVSAVSVAFAASYRFGGHLERLIFHPEPEQLMFRVLGLTLIVAALAELVHVSAAVGAFIVGLAALLPVLPAAAVLSVVSIATKLIAGWYAASRDGVGRRGRVRAGAALIAHGEFSIVIVGLIGVQQSNLGPLVVAYVFILAVAGPLITRFADSRPSPALSCAQQNW